MLESILATNFLGGNISVGKEDTVHERLRAVTVDSIIQLCLKVVQTTGRNSKITMYAAMHSDYTTLYSV